jgi:hypothetical protein
MHENLAPNQAQLGMTGADAEVMAKMRAEREAYESFERNNPRSQLQRLWDIVMQGGNADDQRFAVQALKPIALEILTRY